MWTLGVSVGTDRLCAAAWSPPGVDELRLDGPVMTPHELSSLLPGAPIQLAERVLGELLEQFVSVGRQRYGNVLPAAVTVVLAWDPGSPQCAVAERVLGTLLPGALRRVIAAPVGAPGSPGGGYDSEPARVVAKLGADAVTAGPSQPPSVLSADLGQLPGPASGPAAGPASASAPGLMPTPPTKRRAVSIPVLVFVAVLAAAVAGVAAYVPLQARYRSEHDRYASAVQAKERAEQQSKDSQSKLSSVGGYSLADDGNSSLAGQYDLTMSNTACIGFYTSSCGKLDLRIQIAECSGGVCISADSRKQAFSAVKAKAAPNGVAVSGPATGYTCDDQPIRDATWRLNVWPVATTYDAERGTWKVDGVAASFVIETGGDCDDGLMAWSGSTSQSSSGGGSSGASGSDGSGSTDNIQ